jgi:very-short-patch-repair endonuclease
VRDKPFDSVRGELVEPQHPSTGSGRTGFIDYSLANKVPEGLRKAITEGKKILVLINPPYAKSTNAANGGGDNKVGVAKTKLAATAMAVYGKASNELFTQFVVRIAQEILNATLAMFSTLKYVNVPTIDKFCGVWIAKYLSGFVVHSKAFDGVKGDFPIGFLVWQTSNIPLQNEGVARSDGVVATANKTTNTKNKLGDLPYNAQLKEKARELRKAGNLSEVLFWNAVKNKQLNNLDFDRQRIIGNYIVDFYCHEYALVVEIDGDSHDNKQAYDEARNHYLQGLGLQVLHVQDIEVKKNLSGVIELVKQHIAKSVASVLTTPPVGHPFKMKGNKTMTHTPISEIITEVLDKNAQAIGEKLFCNLPANQLLTNWVARPKTNTTEVIPLKNAITAATATKDLRATKWSDGAIGYLWSNSNDLQQAIKTALFSSGFNGGHGIFVDPENLWQSAIVFSVRRLVKPTWLNDRDQFLQPTAPLSDEFKTDCLLWMLFHGSNLTASANDLEWNDKKWSIVNHFIPFTEAEVNAPDRFESDFMVQYLANKALSPEASAVRLAGQVLWQAYFADTDVRNVRDELKLNRPDVGWYQIRNALKARNASGDFVPVDFSAFEAAYKTLGDKLRPQVYELGFLR